MIGRSMTFGSEVSQLEYITKSRSATLGTEASQSKCIDISLFLTLGAEASQLNCKAIIGSEVSQVQYVALS